MQSIRPFIGASNFEVSRSFYRDLGFQEIVITHNMSLFLRDELGFYLQDAYVKDWIDNTMVFMQVQDAVTLYEELDALNLPAKYEHARLTAIRQETWGKICFLHDPSGVLWQFGQFNS